MISAITTRTSENQVAFAQSSINAQERLSSQRAKEFNQIPTTLAEVQKSSLTAAATSTDTIISSANATEATDETTAVSSAASDTVTAVAQPGTNFATEQAPASDSLIGATTYNSQGQVRTTHSGTGQIFSAAA